MPGRDERGQGARSRPPMSLVYSLGGATRAERWMSS